MIVMFLPASVPSSEMEMHKSDGHTHSQVKKSNKPTTQEMPVKTGQYCLNSLLVHAFYYCLKQPAGMISHIYLTFFPKTSDV